MLYLLNNKQLNPTKSSSVTIIVIIDISTITIICIICIIIIILHPLRMPEQSRSLWSFRYNYGRSIGILHGISEAIYELMEGKIALSLLLLLSLSSFIIIITIIINITLHIFNCNVPVDIRTSERTSGIGIWTWGPARRT